jgi:Cft2 family RNA processing exonuclease
MQSFTKIILVLLMAASSALALAGREVETKDFSGWMKDYDSLVYNEERNAFLFFNEAKRGTYNKVILDEVTVYSKNGEADTEIAEKATSYMSQGVADLLERKGLAASEPGPGVLRLKLAITGAEKSKEDLKAYNFVPVAAVFRGAQAATGNVATYIDTMFEAQMQDSVSGERVAATVAKGIEETEKRSGDTLTFDDVKPTLDKWLAQYEKTLDGYLAKR